MDGGADIVRTIRRHAAACSLGGSPEKTFSALRALLGVTGDVPTLWLVEPKRKQKPENEKAIEEFCGKL